jgi:hypothetical protein
MSAGTTPAATAAPTLEPLTQPHHSTGSELKRVRGSGAEASKRIDHNLVTVDRQGQSLGKLALALALALGHRAQGPGPRAQADD